MRPIVLCRNGFHEGHALVTVGADRQACTCSAWAGLRHKGIGNTHHESRSRS